VFQHLPPFRNYWAVLWAATLLPLAPTTSQTVGGGFETIHQWNGQTDSELFGFSVAGAGDVNGDGYDDLIAGAPDTDFGTYSEAGSASVFSGLDGGLLHIWYGETYFDQFGRSVAGAGDVNGDGLADLMVSASYADVGGLTDAGTVYVYSGADGSLLHKWSGSTRGLLLGSSIAGAGDVNADGFADLAFTNFDQASYRNIVQVYSGLDGSLLHQWDGGASAESFGAALAGAGDVNLDGFDDLIIGAPMTNTGSMPDTGSAMVYSGLDGSLLFQWDGRYDSDFLGTSVASTGDLNLDGYPDLLVGVPGEESGFVPDVGSAHVYSGASGSLLARWYGDASRDGFGGAVSGAGDVNGDGVDDLLVGALMADFNGISEAGSVYLFSGADLSRLYQWGGSAASNAFGGSLTSAGDLDGDGKADVIVGEPYADSGGLNANGTAFAYRFLPYLQASASTISATAGGALYFQIDFPESAANYKYKILISGLGSGPILFGVEIPLTQDNLLIDTFLGNYPIQSHNNLQGSLDSDGNSTADLQVPAGLPASLVGRTFYLAAIANPVGQLPTFSSVATTVTITQ
jgi:FG-GAP repeat protein